MTKNISNYHFKVNDIVIIEGLKSKFIVLKSCPNLNFEYYSYKIANINDINNSFNVPEDVLSFSNYNSLFEKFYDSEIIK
ncbi:MAG: hypothetical protein ABIP51_11185 [Bacteroidia bacterium]